MSKSARALASLAPLAAVVAIGSAAAQTGPTMYVVTLKPGSTDAATVATGLARADGGTVGFVYRHALRGFSIRTTPAGAAVIARSPRVAYVEADQTFTAAAQSMPTGVQRIFAAFDPATGTGNPAIGIDGVDDKRVDVDVAVIDTGIDLDHPDLNVVGSTNCATLFATCSSGGDDGNGHGTHVAGTIGAIDNGIGVVGVAPGARLWSVRVLGNNGTGTTSQIIAGMDWVTAHASTIEVANLSLSGGASASIDAAANRMADAGVAVAVAAGNNNADASSYSPGRAAKVLTVSAMADYDGKPGASGVNESVTCVDEDDTNLNSSNFGSAIEVTAPGCVILSTYLNGGYAWITGTSMATSHVTGALALLASKGFARNYAGVSGLYSTVTGNGNDGWTDESIDGIKEPLLDVSSPVFAPVFVGPPANQAPTASFTFSCSGLTCSFNGSSSSDSDGTIASYSWDFGDGATGTGSTSSHTYAAPGGTFTVSLTVTDDDGATGSISKTVAASAAAPVLALTASSSNGFLSWTAKVTITVTVNGSPVSSAVSGTWSNGASGSSSCSTSPAACSVSKTGISRGTSTVTFTVNTVGGSSNFTGTKTIVVRKP